MSHSRQSLIAVLLFVILLVPAARAQPAAEPKVFDAEAIFTRAAPAVAALRVATSSSGGVGTGFVIDPSGVLITAAHVARQAEHIVADFGDGNPLPARLVGYDARHDLALVKVTPRSPLPSLDVVDSSSVRQGDRVVVIGTPRGRPRVMTTGAVRGLGWTIPGQTPEIFIAFDAIVQPGNSGGPLLNDRGQVVGVVVAGARRGGETLGLATSSSTLRSSLTSLAEGARLERPWLGVRGETLGPDQAQQRQIPLPKGVLVLEVLPNSPASRAGLRGEASDGPPGDVIVAVDGAAIDDWDGLLHALGGRTPGQRVTLTVLRGRARIDVPVTLDARSE